MKKILVQLFVVIGQAAVIFGRVGRSRAAAPIAAAFLLFVLASGLSAVARSAPDSGSSLGDGPRVRAPSGMRIKVQVLNGSGKAGLAVRATRFLRDRGFDVVEAGTSAERLDSTTVLDRSGRGDAARLIALAFGAPRLKEGRDTSRFLDVTVVLGADWVPPPGPFGS